MCTRSACPLCHFHNTFAKIVLTRLELLPTNLAGSLAPIISAFLESRQKSGLFGELWNMSGAPVLPIEQLMAGTRVIHMRVLQHAPCCSTSATKNSWCTDYYTEAARRFWLGAAARWLAAAHRQPLYCPNDVVCTLRGGDARGGGGGASRGNLGEGGGGLLLIYAAPQHFS